MKNSSKVLLKDLSKHLDELNITPENFENRRWMAEYCFFVERALEKNLKEYCHILKERAKRSNHFVDMFMWLRLSSNRLCNHSELIPEWIGYVQNCQPATYLPMVYFEIGFNILRSRETDKSLEYLEKGYSILVSKGSIGLTKEEKFMKSWLLYGLGVYHYDKQNVFRAIELLRESVSIDPKFFYSWAFLAHAFDFLGEYEEAIEMNTRMLEAFPPDSMGQGLLNRGNLYSKSGQYDLALKDILKSKDLLPGNYRPFQMLHLLYHSKGEYEKSIECIDEMIRILKEDEINGKATSDQLNVAYMLKADVLSSMDQWEEALIWVDKSLSCVSSLDAPTSSFILRIQCLRKLNRTKETLPLIDEFVEMIEKYPEKKTNRMEDIYREIGRTYTSLKMFSKCIEYFTKTIELMKKRTKLYDQEHILYYIHERCYAYICLRDYEKAFQDMHEMLTREKYLTYANYELFSSLYYYIGGSSIEKQRNLEKSIEFLDKSLELRKTQDKGLSEDKESTIIIRKARRLSDLHRYVDSIESYELGLKIIDEHQEKVIVLEEMAVIYMDHLQNESKANECLERVQQMDPNSLLFHSKKVEKIENLKEKYHYMYSIIEQRMNHFEQEQEQRKKVENNAAEKKEKEDVSPFIEEDVFDYTFTLFSQAYEESRIKNNSKIEDPRKMLSLFERFAQLQPTLKNYFLFFRGTEAYWGLIDPNERDDELYKLLDTMETLFPNNADICLKRIGLLKAKDKQLYLDFGDKYIKAGIKLCDEHPEFEDLRFLFYNHLAIFYHENRLYEKSLKWYDKAIECNPGESVLWVNKGMICVDMEEYDEAIRYYRKGFEMMENIEILISIYSVHFDLGEYKKAIEVMDEALGIDEDYCGLHQKKAECYEELKMKSEMYDEYRKELSVSEKVKNEEMIEICKKKIKKIRNHHRFIDILKGMNKKQKEEDDDERILFLKEWLVDEQEQEGLSLFRIKLLVEKDGSFAERVNLPLFIFTL